ncbi:MAG: endonuclease/exonuclease/phosphatase family protein [Luteolibacter sp.]
MILRSAALLFFAMSSLGQAVQIRVATFNIGSFYDVTKPQPYQPSLGAPGTSDYEITRATIARLAPDIIALQELHVSDVNAGNVAALASSLGYGHVYIAPSTNAFDTTLRLAFFSRFPFISQLSIASPVGARDMTRLIPAVKVDVPGTSRDPWLFSVHLKAEGGEEADPFQRAVEMRRLTSHINANGLTNEDNFVILGDFNPSGSPRTYNTLPTGGLPGSFDLGSDIPFPVFYFTDPRNYFTTPAVHLLDPLQVNGSAVTRPANSTLDLILTSPVIATRPLATEIYNSALDTSNDVGLPKSGSPLPSGSSATASDHLPVFADIELDPAVPYTFTAAGQTITDNFAGFPGTYDPYPWTISGGSWQRSDNGSGMTAGFRAYGPPTDPSLGFRPSGAPGTAAAAFMNGSPSVLSALRISFTAEQWHSAFGGTADTLGVELMVGAGVTPLPALTFHATTNLPAGAVANGTSTVKEATITGLAIAPGTPFQLRFNFTPGAGNSTPPSAVFINELNYDDNGADNEEFVEIVVGPGFTGALSSVTLFLYNGANGQTYGSHALSTFTAGAVTPSGHRIFSRAISGLQNGEPDGLVIVVNGVVTQFISYEGQFQATNGAASGRMSSDIGVEQTGEDPGGTSSLGLTGIGGAAGPLWWTKFASQPYSQGQANPGQTFTNNNLPPQGIAIDNLAVTFLTGGDTDGDGFSDADEVVFGTNPADAASRFVVNFAYQTPTPGMLRLSFPTMMGRSYVVESCTNFTDWEDEATYSGTGVPQAADFPVVPHEPRRLYRVRVTLQ